MDAIDSDERGIPSLLETGRRRGEEASESLKKLGDLLLRSRDRTAWLPPPTHRHTDMVLLRSAEALVVEVQRATEGLEESWRGELGAALNAQLVDNEQLAMGRAYQKLEAARGGDVATILSLGENNSDRAMVNCLKKHGKVAIAAEKWADFFAHPGKPHWSNCQNEYLKWWKKYQNRGIQHIRDEIDSILEARERHLVALIHPVFCRSYQSEIIDLESGLRELPALCGHLNSALDRDKESCNTLREVVSRLGMCEGRTELPGEELTKADTDLVNLWSSSPTNFEEEALRSARIAEKAAIALYSDMYSSVRDISITQAHQGHNETDWKMYDILADDRCIDIKNARRSYSSRESYSEFYVKKFKSVDTKDVVISGFLSPYKRESCQDVLWIGELSTDSLSRIRSGFHGGKLRLEFRDGLGGNRRLAPWLFEYPAAFYTERNALIRRVLEPNWVWPYTTVSTPLAILVAMRRSCPDDIRGRHEGARLARRLTSLRFVSRPILYCHIVERFLECVFESTAFPDQELREILGLLKNEKRPLYLIDPLATISTLISMLKKIEERFGPNLARFRFLYLRGEGILRGELKDGSYRTLIAYCGGWKSRSYQYGQKVNGVRCGKDPLLLGEQKCCRKCGYLVCSECGHCGCKRNHESPL